MSELKINAGLARSIERLLEDHLCTPGMANKLRHAYAARALKALQDTMADQDVQDYTAEPVKETIAMLKEAEGLAIDRDFIVLHKRIKDLRVKWEAL